MNEESLIEIFKRVGTVVGFRLVFDRETGKPRGYGFCEFADHETALSAVRNLNNVDCGGRPLRIDLADSDPFLEGKTTVRGELVDNSGSNWRERYRDSDRDRDYRYGSKGGPSSGSGGSTDWLSSLPRGTPLAPGQSSMDAISQTVAGLRPGQMMETLSSMKAFILEHPDKARMLLTANPQLAYALFQALLVNQIVDPAILHRMIAATTGSAPPQHVPPPVHPTPSTASALPPHLLPHAQPPYPHQPTPPLYSTPPPPSAHLTYPPPPPANISHSQAPPFYHHAPPPPAAPAPPAQSTSSTSAETANVPEAQRAMLMQMLSLTADQINALPPNERQAIQQLKSQFMALGSIS